MALLTAGYFPTTYFPDSYWPQDYWPEYGTNAPVARVHPHFWMLIQPEVEPVIEFVDKPGEIKETIQFKDKVPKIEFKDENPKIKFRGRK